MKAAIDHSIGAALRACAPQAPGKEPRAMPVRTAREPGPAVEGGDQPHRNSDVGRNRELERDHEGDSGRDGLQALKMHLTPRQLEVLALLCEGLQNKLICRRLNIASGTVKVHISCILRELGVASRLAAVVEAQRLGLVKVENALPVRSRTFRDTVIQTAGGPRTLSIHDRQAANLAAGSGAGRGLLMAA